MKTINKENLLKDITALKEEKNAILLAHNYQRDEIQEIADFTGDSLGLSIEAKNTQAEVIVFCGVHFMAETAAILSPYKKVILPRMDAGCPMADMVNVADLRKRKASLKDTEIVCYVNSSAAVKAESDICCTSANAVKVANSVKTKNVFMVPDKNLANYVSRKTSKNVTWWEGYCPTHDDLTVSDILAEKNKFPNAKFIAHPECKEDVLAHADHICSTSGMYKHVKESNDKEFIIGTEQGILYKLKKENPNKIFHIASSCLICPNMKITRLIDVYTSLKEMKNIIKVEDKIAKRAKLTLDRMLEIPRDA